MSIKLKFTTTIYQTGILQFVVYFRRK